MTADGAPVERLLDVESRPLVSVFLPDRLELAQGRRPRCAAHTSTRSSPRSGRRAPTTRREYSRVLAQRNALLGAHPRRAARRDATLATWDRELARQALALRADRAAAVALLAEPFAERAAQLGLQRRA